MCRVFVVFWSGFKLYFCFLKSRINENVMGKIRIEKLGVPYYTLSIRYKVRGDNSD